MLDGTSRKVFCIAALVLLVVCHAAAADEGCFSCSDLLRLRWVRGPAISPDGRMIAFEVIEPADTSRGERRSNSDVWLVSFDGSRASRRFAFGTATERGPAWSPDGRWLAFLSDRAAEGTMQVYRMRFDGGEAEKITDFEDGASSFAWSSDGRRLAVVAVDPLPEDVREARERGEDERVVDRDDRYSRLWVVDSKTGTGKVVTPESLHVQSVAWSPDGERVAMIVSDRTISDETYWNSRLEVLRLSSEERSILARKAQGNPAWSPDGGSIAFIQNSEHPEVTVAVPLVAVVETNSGDVRLFGRRHQGTLAYPRWMPDGDKLLVVEVAGVTVRLAYLNIKEDKVEPFVDIQVPYYRGNFFDISKDGSRIAVVRGSDKSPPDLWSVERGWFGNERRLTDVNPWLAERNLPAGRAVKWTSRDGTEIDGVLFLPPDFTEGRRYPAVINVHGGPMWVWWFGWHGTWHEWAIPLACRGFIVLLPNPRGSIGNGVGFARANFDDWGGGDFEDVLAGADFLVEKGYADPDRIGIGGWSYGGYMSSWAVTQTKRFAAAVVGAGVTNLFSFHGTTDITPTFLTMYFRDVAARRPEAYRSHSAINFVQNAKTPTLILHGEGDVRVPVGQAYELYRGLQQAGAPTELVVYPREGHGFREIHHQIDLVRRVVEWYERHLK